MKEGGREEGDRWREKREEENEGERKEGTTVQSWPTIKSTRSSCQIHHMISTLHQSLYMYIVVELTGAM